MHAKQIDFDVEASSNCMIYIFTKQSLWWLAKNGHQNIKKKGDKDLSLWIGGVQKKEACFTTMKWSEKSLENKSIEQSFLLYHITQSFFMPQGYLLCIKYLAPPTTSKKNETWKHYLEIFWKLSVISW